MAEFDKKLVNPFINTQSNTDDNENDKMCNVEHDDGDDSASVQSHKIMPIDLTESYSEIIANNSDEKINKNSRPSRPDSLLCTNSQADVWPNTCKTRSSNDKTSQNSFLHNLEGTISVDDNTNMTHFVAENLEYKIKLASPVTKKETGPISSRNSTPSNGSGTLQKQLFFLNTIEMQAQCLASSVDNLTENLCNLLHSISSITADNVETYKNAVNKLTDCMDGNIKSMYTIMAKAEEISNTLKPTDAIANKLRELKRLVDMLEGNI